jgi:hypothetical protein
MPKHHYHGQDVYRDPDTGRFITRARWEEIEQIEMDEFDDWEDFSEFDSFDEEEVY